MDSLMDVCQFGGLPVLSSCAPGQLGNCNTTFVALQSDLVRKIAQRSIACVIPLSQQRMVALSKSWMALPCTAKASATLWASSASQDTLTNDSSPHMAAHLTLPDS